MAALNCSNCSAPLTVESGQDLVDCTYCGTSNRVGGLAKRVLFKLGLGASTGCTVAALSVLLLVFVAVYAALTTSDRSTPPPTPPVVISVPGLPAAAPAEGVSPSELAQSEFPGWIPVAAPAIEGSFTAFDPVANVPWALGIARAWTTDVQVESIYISGVRADGALDISSRDDWDVDYRFYSPALRESARQMAEVSEEGVRSELRIKVGEGQVKALFGDYRQSHVDDPPAYAPRCSFSEVMAKAVEQGLEPRPTYGVVVQHVSAGWRFAISGKDTRSVTVESSTCAAAE